ncbi:MAG TPA: hypothetical protein VF411_08375 [Bacteroidia bacterium]
MKNIPKIQVLGVSAQTPTETLINDALLVKTTGDAVAGGAPVTDLVLHGAANTLQTIYTGYHASPPTYISGQVTTQKNIVVAFYNQNVGYMKGVVNAAAVTAGDVTVGNAVVTRCGFKLKRKGLKGTKTFKGTSTIAGKIDITTKSVGPRATYIRQYGVTPTKDVPPVAPNPDFIISLTADASITNLKSGSIIAIREATIVPVPRKKKTGTGSSIGTPPATGRASTPNTSTNAKKAVFTDGAVHYIFSNWIYVTVK